MCASSLFSPPENLPLFTENLISSTLDPYFYEDTLRKVGYCVIAGVDEAGRGPLAGPVVAAAVTIPQGTELAGVQDSKKMSPKARQEAFSVIHRKAWGVGIGVVSHQYIDEFNVLKASLEAMRRAVLALASKPEFLLVLSPIMLEHIPQLFLLHLRKLKHDKRFALPPPIFYYVRLVQIPVTGKKQILFPAVAIIEPADQPLFLENVTHFQTVLFEQPT